MIMSQMAIDFSIETEGQKQAFKTEGMLVGETLIFHDDKHQKHTIQFLDNSLRYLREGDPSFDFTFEENVLHQGIYQVGKQHLTFDIQTHTLKHSHETLELTYTLKQRDIVINHSALILKYEKMQEA